MNLGVEQDWGKIKLSFLQAKFEMPVKHPNGGVSAVWNSGVCSGPGMYFWDS